MRRRFDADYLRDEFDQLGAALSVRTNAYLIGGGSMAFRDLKDATKDVDLVVEGRATLERIRNALANRGYETVQSPGDDYASLGAEAILENDGCRFDLFVRQVAGELVLSEAMGRRSERFVETGELTVHLVSTEDVFLFKSVAGRTDDVEDMFALMQTGLDFDVVKEEIDRQVDLLGEELFVTVLNESLIDLEERFGARTPIESEIVARTERVYRELELLRALDGTGTVGELSGEIDASEEQLNELLDDLEEKGVVRRNGDDIEKVGEKP